MRSNRLLAAALLFAALNLRLGIRAAGERPAYHPGYYGAFVLDPDGHNVEVVNHNR